MAEAFGIASGAVGLVSLGIQLIESVSKIKKFYHQVKNAPQTLQDIAYELETYGLVLRTLDRDVQVFDPVDSVVLKRCIHQCSRAVERVDEISNKLARSMQSSGLKIRRQLQAALDQGELKRMCEELGDAKTSLALAHALCSEARRTHDVATQLRLHNQHSVALLQLTQLMNQQSQVIQQTSGRTSSTFFSLARHGQAQGVPLDRARKGAHYRPFSRYAVRRKAQREDRVQWSSWCMSKFWDISFGMSRLLNTVSLDGPRLVPWDCAAFNACRDGDLQQLRILYRTGQASPWDYYYDAASVYGPRITAFSIIAGTSDVDALQYLIDVTDDDLISEEWGILLTISQCDSFKRQSLCLRRQIYRTLIQDVLLAIDTEALMNGFDYCFARFCEGCPDQSTLSSLRNALLYQHGSLMQHFFVEIAMSIAPFNFSLMLSMVGMDEINEKLVVLQGSDGTSMLHKAAVMVALSVVTVAEHGLVQQWVEILKLCVCHGIDPSCLDNHGQTPLMHLLRLLSYRDHHRNDKLQLFVHALQEAGVNLLQYCTAERVLCDLQPSNGFFNHARSYLTWSGGSQVTDWTVDVRRIMFSVSLYRLNMPPGTWPCQNKSFLPMKIMWSPEDEDAHLLSWSWFYSHAIALKAADTPLDQFFRDRWLRKPWLWGTQDDNGGVIRLISRSCHDKPRPRSTSQPGQQLGRYPYDSLTSGESWLPRCHFCVTDGRVHLGECGYGESLRFSRTMTSWRRCAKGAHLISLDSMWFGMYGIKQNMDREKRRYERERARDRAC